MAADIRQFRVATEVHMGEGSSAGLLDAVSRSTPVAFRHHRPGVLATGMVERILAPLLAAGIAVDIDDTTKPNPRDTIATPDPTAPIHSAAPCWSLSAAAARSIRPRQSAA